MMTRWNPWREMARMQRDLDQIFGSRVAGEEESTQMEQGWQPEVDVLEDEERFVLSVDLPGVEPGDVAINLEENRLSVKGERKLAFEEQRQNYHRIERTYGPFSRTFTLPASADGEKVEAEFKFGVLNIVIPKRAETKPRQISVKVAE